MKSENEPRVPYDAIPSMAHVHSATEMLAGISSFDTAMIAGLEGLKEKMEGSGFSSPFRGLVQRTMEEAGDLSEAEWSDLKKQNAYFRYIANLKKYSMARVNIALDAHRIARGFEKMGYGDVVGHLPLDGNHIRLLMESGDDGVVAYRELMDKVEGAAEKKGCFIAKVKSNGTTESVQVAEGENLEMKVSRMFGVGAEIVSTRPGVRSVPILGTKGVRIALVSAIVHYVSKSMGKEMGMGAEAALYNSRLAEFGIRPDVRMDMVSGFEKEKAELAKSGFLVGAGGKYAMKGSLKTEIMGRRRKRAEETRRRSALLLLSPIFKFYLMNNEEARRKENLYPSLAITPGDRHMMLFSYMDAEGLPARSLLKRKIGMEGKVPLAGKELASALLMDGGKDAAWVSEYIGIEKEKAEGALYVLRNFSQGKRGAEFVGRIRKKD
ncbi:MAG: DUF530 family protein [Candidatus ainarchaeum sp.]|nr:DUF530 family protein [Candidatus ainarchaeum sp.]MDD5096236.1 DUF530 family protein [Candidatus ainarchaeum sp.]